ncbi:MAG TPA: acylneuraminate cytidylyltransferase family protein [Pyrinomonadaceae bacterium]|nr:acylneuraminate cytidylyltransferase family protein [Pyrinomonadaceae bacterium]
MASTPSIVALIPARAGSKRVPDKNIKRLGDHPLVAYTIAAARESGIFAAVIVSTDSEEYLEVARYYGAEAPYLRPAEISGDLSPDIEWVFYTLKRLHEDGRSFDCFSILRPTSPFRLPSTIAQAWKEFLEEDGVDSLRAVEKCQQHPGKMWVVRGKRMVPLMPLSPPEQPWHSSQYQSLPVVYVQNASLEIAWSRVVFDERTIAGSVQMPFFLNGYEGFDVNQPHDWQRAEEIARSGVAVLPSVSEVPFQTRNSLNG